LRDVLSPADATMYVAGMARLVFSRIEAARDPVEPSSMWVLDIGSRLLIAPLAHEWRVKRCGSFKAGRQSVGRNGPSTLQLTHHRRWRRIATEQSWWWNFHASSIRPVPTVTRAGRYAWTRDSNLTGLSGAATAGTDGPARCQPETIRLTRQIAAIPKDRCC